VINYQKKTENHCSPQKKKKGKRKKEINTTKINRKNRKSCMFHHEISKSDIK